ncbi:MAG: YceI family protein [Candidatus Kapabacteria bacterium]|nr:YceI family protein [Candidatus Kapabacteria bacterium]
MKKNIIIILAIILFSFNAYSSEYNVDKSKKNLVKFTSKMTLDDFDGTTDKIDGFMADSKDGLLNSNFYFEVDMNTLTTNMGLRDRHMRDNYLHTSKYPKSNYKGNITSVQEKNGKFEVVVEGDFFIHGVGKKTKINASLIPDGNNGFKVVAKFIVKLTDYKIEIPQMMFAKINENMDVVIDFMLKKVK